ncbi:MAG: ATP-binding protein [Gaiellales bacterium]
MKHSRVLLVDDDSALLEALPETVRLHMDGVEIDTCDSAREALERIEAIDYDAIVTDIKMPGMDGLALLLEIKERRPSTPTLLITGHGERDLAVRALRGGAYDFLQKPIDRNYFVASLERAIQLRGLDRRVEDQRQALERHARVLEHVGDGVFLVDVDGVIRLWNRSAERIMGLSEAAVLERRAGEAIPGWADVASLVPTWPTPGPAGGRGTVPLDIGGRELWISISGIEFSDGVVYAFRDVTDERRIDSLKDEFVATVSHEVRTPLSAIYGASMTLQRKDLEVGADDRARLVAVIASEADRLARIINEILLANHIDSGRLRMARERVDVTELAGGLVETLRMVAPESIRIEVAGSDGLPPIETDGDRLRQVLVNLLENAVKYSPDGGVVELRIDRKEAGVRFSVRDQGLGIPSSEYERIFDKFYRLDPHLTRGVGGTGLGLYICRELVRRLGGRISVSSETGRGSTFFVDLPVEPLPATGGETSEVPAASAV